MGRITNYQNEIKHLQQLLHDRNAEVKARAATIAARDKEIGELKDQLKEALLKVA